MSQHKDPVTGKWYYTGKYKDILGKRHDYKKRGFNSKKAAKKAEDQFLLKIKGGYGRLTVNALIEIFNTQNLKIKDPTRVLYMRLQKNFISPYLGDKYIDSIKPLDIEKWTLLIANKKKKNGEPFKWAYQCNIFDCLYSLFGFATRKKLLDENPCKGLTAYKDPNIIIEDETEIDAKTNFWEVDTYIAFMSKIDNQENRDIYETLFYTGLRIGEFVALKWEDFYDDKLHIRRMYSTTLNRITTPKTNNSIRTISLPSILVRTLNERYKRVSRQDGFNSSYFIFGSIKPISTYKIRSQLYYDIERTGVKRITPHGFRHSHASYLLSNPIIPEALVAARLGDTIDTLQKTYAHVYQKYRQTLTDYLDIIEEMSKTAGRKMDEKV